MRAPCVEHHVVVYAWSARIAKCAAPQQWNAFLNAFLSSSRAKATQKCVQKCIPLLRCREFREVRVPYVDHQME
eukprot:3931740-Lingulodinium_polyedra.AAC.1